MRLSSGTTTGTFHEDEALANSEATSLANPEDVPAALPPGKVGAKEFYLASHNDLHVLFGTFSFGGSGQISGVLLGFPPLGTLDSASHFTS